MTTFCNESKLLIENWKTFKAIGQAEAELRREFTAYLYSMEKELAKCDWWDESWQFVRHTDNQIYISRRDWLKDDNHSIWIGVESFVPNSFFGSESASTLYVWAYRDWPGLAGTLASELENNPNIIGSIDTRTKCYVVKQPMRKCLPEELDLFCDIIGKQIIDFFSFYAGQAELFDRAIAKYFESEGTAK
jgi:hypothetical protein